MKLGKVDGEKECITRLLAPFQMLLSDAEDDSDQDSYVGDVGNDSDRDPDFLPKSENPSMTEMTMNVMAEKSYETRRYKKLTEWKSKKKREKTWMDITSALTMLLR